VEKKLYRYTSTFSTLNLCGGIFFKSLSYLYAWSIDGIINTLLGGQTLDPAGMRCPSRDDDFVSGLFSKTYTKGRTDTNMYRIQQCCEYFVYKFNRALSF